MDTKTPPIPLKHQEKRNTKREKSSGAGEDLSLPPLAAGGSRHKSTGDKKNLGQQWTNGAPYVARNQEHQSARPYRVLHIGATPLMHACQQGDRSRVLRLLKEQQDTINYRDRTLRNALHYCMDASTGGAVASAAPQLVNASDAEGHTPLHLAVIAGDTQLVAVLLANGADVNAKDLEGHSVLHWATVCGESECVRLVLAAGARPSTPDLRGGSPLHYAAQCCGAAATAELSVPKKVGLKVLHTLLEFGANVNSKDEDGRQPILWAASAGSVEAVLALARAGGTAAAGATDKDGLTALHCAASRGHARCVEALVNLCGSQPDHVDDNGCSALHYAATLGHADGTALLLKLGADPNRQDRKGRTPALCAAAKGQLETLKILAQHGGSLHARTVRGTGVAHEAVLSGRIELIEWLARKKPSTLDVATHDGRTPLHVAALHGYLDICKVLLDHRARINSVFRTSKNGPMTPLDAALYRGHRDCAKLIQMHGGATAQHVRSHRIAPNRVFATKVKHKPSNSTSQSDTDSPHHHQKSNIYIEEHWIEKRTRKHSNSRLPSSRRGSRSFSEEEIRLSKTLRDRRRRAKSESSRYEGNETEEKQKKIRRRRSKHEYSESSSDLDSSSPMSPEKNQPDSPANRSLSDDSLEVVVVRRSMEKKSEKVQFSDKKSSKPKETSREMRLTETEHRSSRRKPKRSVEIRKRPQDGNVVEKSKSSVAKAKSKSSEAKPKKEATDSTSQEAVERVTVTAIVHKDQPPDTPEVTLEMKPQGEKGQAENLLKKKSKIDEILEKADEMQSALITKAEDLRRGVEDVRRQVSKEVPLGGGDENEEEEEREVEGKRKEKKRSSGSDVSRSGQQSEQEMGGESRKKEGDEEKENGRESQLSSSGSGSPGKKSQEGEGERSAPSRLSEKSQKSVRSEMSGKSEKSKMSAKSEKSRSSEKSDSPGKSGKLEKSERSKRSAKTEKSRSSEKSDSPGKSGKSDKSGSPTKSEKSDSPEMAGKLEKKRSSEKSEVSQKSEKSDTAESPEKSEKMQKSSRPESLEKSQSSERSESSEKSAVEAYSPKKSTLKVTESALQKTSQSRKSSSESSKSEQKAEMSEEVHKPSENQRAVDMSTNKDKTEEVRHIDSRSASPKESRKVQRPSTAKRSDASSSKSPDKGTLFESPKERSPDRSAIVAVIDSPEWDEEDEEVVKEIRKVVDEGTEDESEPEDDDGLGVLRVLPSTSEEETPKRPIRILHGVKLDNVPLVERRTIGSPRRLGVVTKQRKDSGGRDSGIEPSPRVSKIPKRTTKCCPNTEKQQALNMETIQRDVQISLRRYHLERKIFFQLMELKRLQIRHGKVNEHILVKRQVDTFNKAGMSGPILGVVKYDQALTFRDFESFLYDQLRRLQRRTATPDWCTEAKQCTQKTHRCHHATSAYTSVPIYTYLDGEGHREREATLLPRIESRGKGQMTVEVTKGEETQVISLPTEQLDRTKKYFITFTVRGETQPGADEVLTNRRNAQRNTKSV